MIPISSLLSISNPNKTKKKWSKTTKTANTAATASKTTPTAASITGGGGRPQKKCVYVHGTHTYILADVAARVLSIPPSEAECERTFSVAGRVHSKTRNSLSGDHINQVVSLHQWLHMDARHASRASALRSATTTASASRFATLKLIDEMHFAPDPADVDDEDDEDV